MSSKLKTFERLSKNPHIRLVSVDIFDTLLLRTTMPEKVKFGKFGKEKSKTFKPANLDNKINPKYLHILRNYAARIAYRNRKMFNGAREATLDEIYDVMLFSMQADLKLSKSEISNLKLLFREIEITLEKKDLTVNIPLKKILSNATSAGKKVVAISDMYLSHEDLKEILVSKGVWDIFDDVYVSSQFGYGKASGYIFEKVLSLHDFKPYQAIHIGDNWYSDYKKPHDKGIFAFHYPRTLTWRAMRKLRESASYHFHGLLE